LTSPGDRSADRRADSPAGAEALAPEVIVRAAAEFLRLESASGILLFIAAVLAMLMANSPLSPLYAALLEVPIEIRVSELLLAKPLLHWINDGLMAVFFLLVGLEIKREIMDGELSSPSRVLLPAAAAAGGMIAPALIYAWFNRADPVALAGWAIPSATDIAFALGVLALLGKAVPIGLKLFLLTLAVLDDLGAVLIIAVFYSGNLAPSALAAAGLFIACLAIMNRRGVNTATPYLLVGACLWIAVLKSGVHATLAGAVLAMFIPLNRGSDSAVSPLRQLENDLHPTVAYVVLPAFAFANSGVPLAGIGPSVLLDGVPLGIVLGLFLGKQLGIVSATWFMVKLRFAPLPEGVDWRQIHGVSLLCGVGFTMSLFIGSLAFEHQGQEYGAAVRLGILAGSTLCGTCGYLVLRRALRTRSRAS
jgi:NhaA family Na+:H+ antiporter